MFLCSGGGTKTKHYIFVKNGRSPRTLFFLENTAYLFGVKRRNERAERAELRNGGRTLKAGGRSVAKAGKAAAETERSERKAEGGDRRETTEPMASERSERAFTDQVKRPATRP